MFRESTNIQSVGYPEISTVIHQSALSILFFIDKTIPGFKNYYLLINADPHENLVSFHIVNYFNSHLQEENDGFSPVQFLFVKNPPQTGSKKETDIGVVPLSKSGPLPTIIEFEAKRFCSSANNKEYVCGERGGIERFKRSEHGSHLSIAGMFGYIQETGFLNCAERINNWISELAISSTDSTIDWTSTEEKLLSVDELSNVTKWSSLNTRLNNNSIQLFHYLLDLTN
jgi:hypothetical protein